jgi:hypothetical protein
MGIVMTILGLLSKDLKWPWNLPKTVKNLGRGRSVVKKE